MKKVKYCCVFITLLLFISSCQRDKYSHFIASPKITESFTSGQWHVNFGSTKNDSSYASYRFHFNKDNTLLVYHNSAIYHGKWYVMRNWETDDAPPSDIEFSINFLPDVPAELKLLSHNYQIIQHTDSRLELMQTDAIHSKKMIFEKK